MSRVKIGNQIYESIAEARRDGWVVRNDGMAHRGGRCPLGGRHRTNHVPADGTLPKCVRCGQAFSHTVAVYELLHK